MCDPYVGKYFAAPSNNYGIYNKTKYRTNYDYNNGRIRNRGVDVEYIRNMGGRNIREREINFVTDPNGLNRNTAVKEKDRDVIRTYQVSRDDVKSENIRNVEIKKSDRNSSLEINRIAVGDNRSKIRTDDKNIKVRDEKGDFKSVNTDRTVERKKVDDVKINERQVEQISRS